MIFSTIKGFFQDWGRMLYWIFFKPSGFRTHLREIAPELPEFTESDDPKRRATRREMWRLIKANRRLRDFLIEALVVTVATPFIFEIILNLSWTYAFGRFNLTRGLVGVAVGVAGGVAIRRVAGSAATTAGLISPFDRPR